MIGGGVLVLVAVLGFFGIIGPTAGQSVFGSAWWFDNSENWAHLVVGGFALVAAIVMPGNLRKALVMTLGMVAILVGLYSLIVSTSLFGANLENPLDTVLHLAIGAWALLAARSGKK